MKSTCVERERVYALFFLSFTPLCVVQVSRWLETLFGAEAVPEFEVSTRTIELLDELAQVSELRCKETSLLTDDYRHKAAEYSSDGTQFSHCY